MKRRKREMKQQKDMGKEWGRTPKWERKEEKEEIANWRDYKG
jgi:hypothetical protein